METKQEYKKAIDYLCALMQEGKIKKGDKFPTERNISETLVISRNSTREALRVMECMGVMERRQGSGNYMINNMSTSLKELIVLMLTINSINKKELCEFRRQMEKAVCTVIINCNNDDFCKMMIDLLNEKTYDLQSEVNRDKKFHQLLIEKTENRFWIILMNAVMEVYREWIDYIIYNANDELREALKKSHLSIIEGIKNHDIMKCLDAIDSHYDLIEKNLK